MYKADELSINNVNQFITLLLHSIETIGLFSYAMETTCTVKLVLAVTSVMQPTCNMSIGGTYFGLTFITFCNQ